MELLTNIIAAVVRSVTKGEKDQFEMVQQNKWRMRQSCRGKHSDKSPQRHIAADKILPHQLQCMDYWHDVDMGYIKY